MIHQPKVELQERIKKIEREREREKERERERERVNTFLGKNVKENNKKYIENKMRKKE